MSRIPDMLKPMTFPIPRLPLVSLMRWSAIAILAAMLPLTAVTGARAQITSNPEIQTLMQRIEGLQRDMNTLQRRVYRGDGAAAAATAGEGDSAAAVMTTEPNLAAAMQVRLDEIEGQMRAFTGRLEETNHAISELTKKLEALSGDIDLRFQALRTGAPVAGGAASSPGTPPPVAAAPTKPGVLGTLSLKDVAKSGVDQATLAAPAGKDGAKDTSVLPKGTAQEQYQFATSFLARSDWTRAEQALTAFLAAHGKHPLAGNAQYWLGESHYVRGDYGNAALAFAKGYKEFPKSAKGPDNLLKLGLSLANLKKTASACKTFARVAKDFPGASAAIKTRAAAERKKLRCR